MGLGVEPALAAVALGVSVAQADAHVGRGVVRRLGRAVREPVLGAGVGVVEVQGRQARDGVVEVGDADVGVARDDDARCGEGRRGDAGPVGGRLRGDEVGERRVADARATVRVQRRGVVVRRHAEVRRRQGGHRRAERVARHDEREGWVGRCRGR